MANIKAQISLKDTPAVKTLVELLTKYQDELPEELNQELNVFADCKTFEFTADQYQGMGGKAGGVETDFHTPDILSANPVLKRVRWREGDGYTIHTSYPERFRLGCNGAVFIQWGYDDEPNV